MPVLNLLASVDKYSFKEDAVNDIQYSIKLTEFTVIQVNCYNTSLVQVAILVQMGKSYYRGHTLNLSIQYHLFFTLMSVYCPYWFILSSHCDSLGAEQYQFKYSREYSLKSCCGYIPCFQLSQPPLKDGKPKNKNNNVTTIFFIITPRYKTNETLKSSFFL